MLFVEVIFKNLLRRRTRAILTTAGVAVAVAAMTSLLSIAWNYADSAASLYASRNVDIAVVRAGVAERFTSSLRANLADSLRSLPGVAKVDGSLTEAVSMADGGWIGVPLHGLDPAGFALAYVTIDSGRTLHAGDEGQVLMGASLARTMGKVAGDPIAIEEHPFKIAGTFEGANPMESNTVIALLSDVQKLMDRPDQVSEFQLQVEPTLASVAGIRRVCHDIEALRDGEGRPLGLKAQPTRDFVDSDTETHLARAMAWGTSIIAILISTLGMLNTMLMSVLERTREFGILRAIGWSRSRVVRMIMGESLLLSVLAACLGLAGAWIFVRVAASTTAVRSLVRPELSFWACVLGCALGFAAGLIGSFYPAYRGANIPATEALRYE